MPTRRAFLAASGTLALSARAYAAVAEAPLNIGCIGTGGRCRALMKSLNGIKGVRLAALSDVSDASINEAKKLADKDAFVTRDYAELLARKDIAAVVIGSPDHWHAKMTLDAMAAGKDVYVEKPLTHDMSEGAALIDAAKTSKCVVQVGTQQRSMEHIIRAKDLVASGRLGTIHKVRMSWNRNTDRIRRTATGLDPKTVDWKRFLGSAKEQPFDDYKCRNWRWFWDFGGGLFTDLMVHWIDVAHWMLECGEPTRAVSVGTHVASKGVWETPDTVQTLLTYRGGVQMHYEGTFSNRRAGAMIELMGTDGTLYIDRGRFEFVPENAKGKAEELVLGTGPKGRDFYDKPDGERVHLENWLSCVKSRKKPTAPIEAGVQAANAAHLANQALRGTGLADRK